MASVQLAFKPESEHTRNSYKLDMPQGSLEGKTQAVAQVELENLVVLEVRVVVEVEGYEVLMQPHHQLDLLEVGLVLAVMVVVDPYYKKK